MIVITGGAGFIGSVLIASLNMERYTDIVVVDDFASEVKCRNLGGKIFREKVERFSFFDWLDRNEKQVQLVFHIGAKSATTGFDQSVYLEYNLEYSKKVWNACVKYGLPLIYASSAATYGMGEFGYDDSHELIPLLKPLNWYGESKNDFDKWVLLQEKKPFYWAGLKYFNVFGPNEYHKGRMASVVYHTFNQIKATGAMKLFKSHHPDFKDGHQTRDFVYVKDVSAVMLFLMEKRPLCGIFNIGTGKGRTFLDLASATFRAMGLHPNIQYIDTPIDIRDKYQYFTEARMEKLRSAGYEQPFQTLEAAIDDYVKKYLMTGKYF